MRDCLPVRAGGAGPWGALVRRWARVWSPPLGAFGAPGGRVLGRPGGPWGRGAAAAAMGRGGRAAGDRRRRREFTIEGCTLLVGGTPCVLQKKSSSIFSGVMFVCWCVCWLVWCVEAVIFSRRAFDFGVVRGRVTLVGFVGL